MILIALTCTSIFDMRPGATHSPISQENGGRDPTLQKAGGDVGFSATAALQRLLSPPCPVPNMRRLPI